jgi:hypothetical protein
MVDWASFAAGVITPPLLIYLVLSVMDAMGYRIRMVAKVGIWEEKS